MVTDSVTMNTSMRAVDSTDARMVWMVSICKILRSSSIKFRSPSRKMTTDQQTKQKPKLKTALVRMVLQGGCQCCKIRYTVDFDEATAQKNFCHCRMCQLATGSPVAAFFTVQKVR